MKRVWWLGVAVVAVLLGVRAARARDAVELWMWSAPADAPDDAEAVATFVGTMVSGTTCEAMAEGMTAHMRQTRKAVVAFECR